jgi:hypothetical protein
MNRKLTCLVVLLTAAAIPAKAAVFEAYRPDPTFQLPEIVLQYDPATKTGINWADVKDLPMGPAPELQYAVKYLGDGLKRMTGKEFVITSKNDLSKGIVLTLFKNAPKDIQNDREVQQALKANPKDLYAANEAFLVRSEKNRLLLVANTPDGLTDAVADLLESVDYEVLGMGTDWIAVPDHREKALVFSVDRADRPSFYIRELGAHSGQFYGMGTILKGLSDPADEDVYTSYMRWMVGTRMSGSSMPPFPGHALQAYHAAVLAKMNELGSKEGFLADLKSGPAAQRPPASTANKGMIWMNTDAAGKLDAKVFYYCDGTTWQLGAVNGLVTLDLSSRLVREVVLEDMKKQALAQFATDPDDPLIFAIECEDGETGGADRDRLMAHKNWYPDYLASEGLPFGRPYALNGFKGLNQPKEIWDPTSSSDTIFGFANYLLHEFDKWVDSLPKAQQVTSTGKSMKDLIRCSLLSYNYHDVPPNFNLDPRIRVSIAGYPKNRGMGKWAAFSSHETMARAFHLLLPDSPSADYAYYSFSFYRDGGPEGIPATLDASPKALAEAHRDSYDAGFRSFNAEVDFNYGKNGLLYYLASKMLWNANLTAGDLNAIRDRWLQRSFGSAWREMKAYYDFLLPDNYLVNSPNSWGKAVQLLDAADRKIDGVKEPQEQRRIDDVKQYWYGHYLFDTGKYTTSSPEVKEFLWKGQMSYITGMEGLMGREFKSMDVAAVVGPQISAGPAHYTHAETQAWWAKVLAQWPVTPVTLFSEGSLANGKPAKAVDLNDLVMVKEFQATPTDHSFLYDSASAPAPTFLMAAAHKGDLIGFKMYWPFNVGDPHYAPRNLPYGVEIWNPAQKVWETWFDPTVTSQPSEEVTDKTGAKFELVDVKLKAKRAGTYRFSLGPGGDLCRLGSPAYDPLADTYSGRLGFSFSGEASGLTQAGVYIYIPQGTKSLDLEVWDVEKVKFVTFYHGLPSQKMTSTRQVDIGSMGAHKVPLQPGEDGTVALITGNCLYFPFLYSVPKLWAGSPASLLVPRGIAQADGLTILPSP